MNKIRNIQWPALLVYYNDDELAYITNEIMWKNDPDYSTFNYDSLDYLLDSSGYVFSLQQWHEGLVQPTPTGKQKTLDTTITLVRKHASQLGFCCMSKLYAGSIEEAILLCASLED